MTYTLTVNTKGQVVIPKEVRDIFAIGKYLKLEINKEKQVLEIRKPVRSLSDMAGCLKNDTSPKEPPTKEQMKELRKKIIAKKHGSN
ncbi:hypothetical protein NIES267_73400 (plasmid) [Calothrix parasitica NIES-267]|uniref:SpoVT-AbrB domain-containing protein n=1 Tax=Calothrix parasitica NIES-267 TaxID=1973488 RepID=A0A1Z4M2X8_9CYAN|nr:hypothetical protein NIES267_73400 [Calothrix parasitica NIES-267]